MENRRKGRRKEGRKKKKKKKGQRTSLTLVLLDLPFLYYSLSCSKISLTEHPAPSPRLVGAPA